MPAAADTGVPSSACGCVPAGDSNPSQGRAVINEELSEGDEVVVEFIPSDLPASTQGAQPAQTGGTTAVDGGNVQNDTAIAVDAQGGDADAAASGGDFNLTEVISGGGSDVEADAGSGGVADAAATGGAVVIGNVNSGANAGNQIEVNQLATGKILCFTPEGKAIVEVPTRLSMPAGNAQVSGGNVSNETNIAVDASGGTADADASGGDGNIVVVSGSGNVDASAGSGGTAEADASGGVVVIGDVNSGGNTGNVITVGDDDLTDQIKQRVNERVNERLGRGDRAGDCVPPPCVTPPNAVNSTIGGGNVSSETNIAVDASGGTASADATGGDDNIVQVEDSGGRVSINASAGSGGGASADASGGAVEIGTVRSGGNTGNAISFNNVTGQLLCLSGNDTLLMELDLSPKGARGPAGGTSATGGNVSNDTDIAVDASGGTASADASGGDGNIVISTGQGNVDASAGSGGTASADASGGSVVVGDVNSGGNTGGNVDDEDDEDEDD